MDVRSWFFRPFGALLRTCFTVTAAVAPPFTRPANDANPSTLCPSIFAASSVLFNEAK